MANIKGIRRVGRYSKQEVSELIRMFDEGNSIYKICKNLNRSQKSIRNNLIRLGKMEVGNGTKKISIGLKKLQRDI